jgi:hypothetical protein
VSGSKRAQVALPVEVTARQQLAELRWDWAVVVLRHATDPRIKQVVMETVARANRPSPEQDGPADRARLARIAAETGYALATVQAVLEAADRLDLAGASTTSRAGQAAPTPAPGVRKRQES